MIVEKTTIRCSNSFNPRTSASQTQLVLSQFDGVLLVAFTSMVSTIRDVATQRWGGNPRVMRSEKAAATAAMAASAVLFEKLSCPKPSKITH